MIDFKNAFHSCTWAIPDEFQEWYNKIELVNCADEENHKNLRYRFPLSNILFCYAFLPVINNPLCVHFYGDDIIIYPSYWDALIEYCGTIGLKVNGAKSYSTTDRKKAEKQHQHHYNNKTGLTGKV